MANALSILGYRCEPKQLTKPRHLNAKIVEGQNTESTSYTQTNTKNIN